MSKVGKILKDHYRNTIIKHGAGSKGVDWGESELNTDIRHEMMLNIIKEKDEMISILDVGCGYGAFYEYINKKNLNVNYTGIDIVSEMIDLGINRNQGAEMICDDFLDHDFKDEKYDYVICNGILTQKVTASISEMNEFANKLIKKMYFLCGTGIVFNVMSTHVNFQKDNLYYRNPSELMSWCMSEISPHIKLDAAYPLTYEYTMYVYKPLE